MKYSKDRGFTLIELLVVIAIIGILSGIVMASLGTARKKAADKKVQAQLASARAAAELFKDQNGGYNGIAGDISTNCAAADSMFTDTASGMAQYTDPNNYPAGTDMRCSSNADAYMISASLSDPTEFWCVDSTGNSTKITGADHATAHPPGDILCD